MKLVSILLLILALPAAASAETVPQLFDAGVAEYRQGNFDRSAGIFLDLYEKYDVKSPDVLANLGSAEFGAGRPGPAMKHLMMATRMAPDSRAGQTAAINLDRIRALLNESQEGRGGPAYVFGAYTDPWIALFSWLDRDWALTAFLVCWALFFVVLSLRRLMTGKASMTALATAMLLMSATAAGAYASSRIAAYRTGVVLTESAGLLADVASTETIADLPEGLEFRILEVRGTWIRVRLSSGLSGWLQDSDAGIP